MGLRDLTSIDIVLEKPPFETEECKLILVIVDATQDLAPAERYQMLLRKLTSYISYVAGPQLGEDHPGMKAEDVIVRVLTVTPATAEMLAIDAIRTKDGARLRVFFDDYHKFMLKVRASGPQGPSKN